MPLSVEKRDLTGLTAIVTGGNTGIGLETARMLSEMGANVTIACRNVEKGQGAAKDIENTTGNAPSLVTLDLASFESTKTFVETIKEKHQRIDILVNNAGYVSGHSGDDAYTIDGIETDAQVNHLSQFYLTNHLLPLIKNAAQNKINNFVPRIVVVASDAIGAGKVNISYWKKEGKDKLPYFLARYADTKLALCIVSKKWAEEVESDGIVVHFLHPGVVYTEIHAKPDNGAPKFVTVAIGSLFKLFGRSVSQGAMTSVHCAVSVEAEKSTGKYWKSCKIASYTNSLLTNKEVIDQLWEDSVKILKEKGYEI